MEFHFAVQPFAAFYSVGAVCVAAVLYKLIHEASKYFRGK